MSAADGVVVTAPCQRCGEHIMLGNRGYGWNFLCRECFDDEAEKDARLTTITTSNHERNTQ